MHYITFLLIKASQALTGQLGKNQSLNQLFSFDFFICIIDFFINLQMTTEWAFAFLSTTVIMFCLIYSLNTPRNGFSLLEAQH